MRRPRAWLIMCLVFAAPAGAQTIVTSPRPDSVGVTVYRAPNRSADEAINLEWLDGYALITETRRVAIPAGESEVRFEGVAGGIVPQSAIVSGFPDGVVERNRDAWLLSPESLLDRSLGRRVHLRRTSRATGAITEQDAVIRAGADGGMVVQTAEGIEALRCTGQSETLVYPGVPVGLSARPTLSVRTRAARPVEATVTLSYLATGFDWQANYIARLSSDGSRTELFAWLTLASTDETSFTNAQTQAVAGRLNRAETERDDGGNGGGIQLRCWPQGNTSTTFPDRSVTESLARVPGVSVGRFAGAVAMDADESSIVVTGMRASQENLGDVKLYRIPEPVTVAANSQKQVAFLEQPRVTTRIVYRSRIEPGYGPSMEPATRTLVTRNRTDEGLGLPLPAGSIQFFTDSPDGRPLLLGEGVVRDLAIGEDVEIEMGEAPGILVDEENLRDGDDWEESRLTVTNDRDVPIRFEAEFRPNDEQRFRALGARLGSRHGRPLWAATVPANGSVTLDYRVTETD